MNLQTENTLPVKTTTLVQLETEKQGSAVHAAKHEPPALSLDERGMIKDCNKAFEKLVGFRRSELVWRHVSAVFPELNEAELFQKGQVNPMLSYLSRCGQPYRTQNQLGETTFEKLSFVRIDNRGKPTLRLIVRV